MIVQINYPDGATPLDPNEIGGLRYRHVKTQAQLNELEQANISSGLLWLGRMRRRDVLTTSFILEFHRRLFGEVWTWAGKFRTTGKNIGVDPQQIVTQLHGLMGDARYWIDNGTYRPHEAAARLHHRLVSIHPFTNGNGRHARIMADVVLEKIFQTDAIDWTAGADLQSMNDRRVAYITALRAADNHDLEPLLRFVGLSPADT
jgi:Fic-DOC domain mobile mystery protein B